MIEVGQRERPAVLQEIETNRAGNIGKRAIAIVRVEDVALVAAPGVVGADEFVDARSIPARSRAKASLRSGELATTCRQKKLFRSSRERARDHAVGDVEIGKAVVIEIPGIARP